MPTLSTKLSTLQLNNPTILASGIMGEDAGSIQRIIDSGAGAIVTKSIGITARNGYPNPTLLELNHGLLNAMGLPNPGIDCYTEELQQLTKQKTPIIGSIYGSNTKEFSSLAQQMEHNGVNAIELNLSCPHAQGYGLELGSDPKKVYTITKTVKENITIPVFVKLSPNVTNIVQLAQEAHKANADAVVAINTVKAMKIDLETRTPVLSNKIGGYSGKAIKPIGVRCVYEIAEHVDIPIIGVGGITTGEDALEYIMAGATAVEIGSAVYYQGLDIFKTVCFQIQTWMKHHHVKKLTDLIGVAHP